MHLPPHVKRTEMPFTGLALDRSQDELQSDCCPSNNHKKGKIVVVVVVTVITVFKAGSYSDHESNIYAKMHLNSILLNKLPSL